MHIIKKALVLILILILFSVTQVLAYEIRPIDIGYPSGFTCHPSWSDFTSDTMAADFIAERTGGDAPFTVTFYDISYGHPESWYWDFGDGNTSEDQNPTYTYLVPGKYDVSLVIGTAVQHETSNEDFLKDGHGQLTDMKWQSTARKLSYIIVAEGGSGTDQPVPVDFYPEPKNATKMPSGLDGAQGSAHFEANTVTITPNTQKAYTEVMNINGVYNLAKITPYNDAF
jgi:hypothetical protein